MKKSTLIVLLTLFISTSCEKEDDLFDINAVRAPLVITSPNNFADPNLNQQAKDLYDRLINITQKGIAFGQQQPFGTGNDFPVSDKLQPDFFPVTGDYPAIAGFDLELISLQPDSNTSGSFLDEFINRFTKAVIEAHENGSIITMSWHHVNPQGYNASGEEIFNGVVAKFLEGGEFRQEYIERLARAARLLNKLVDAHGNSIPVLFRPWHEMNGNFFFWGEGYRTTENFVQLWKDTIKILSEDFNVHNLIYVYAPNLVSNKAQYLKNYPGDQFVDMLGIDVYDFRNRNFLNSAIRNLKIVEDIALEKNMLFALTETGLENVVDNTWWTQSLYKAIRASSITYTMVWRNDMTTFFHVPYLGHPAENNFKEFLEKEIIFLSSDIL
ncbi:glycoside hydrolase family 26 protein [uncultured Algibacter sp.]|uniref:glycoside hydrolase family 26 protein n=1 Tax=uncultured Algibacter sp. TaxID=298659 RepID=UPI00261DED2E|nr:glycosyl hydrolase [uncultured Algibacter sp.]